jgi:hypothetical protein
MPLYIRRLPVAEKHALLDPKLTSGQATTFFNPSRAGNMLYIRMTDFVQGGLTQKNKMLLYNVFTKQTQVVETPWDSLVPTVNMFQGIEDLRLCEWNGKLWFAGTTTHVSDEMTNELIVGYFNPEKTAVETLQRVDIGHLPVKNVCPFVWRDALCLWDAYKRCVYRLTVTEEKPEITAEVIQRFTVGPGLPETAFRGSTSPIHLHGSLWGCVVHDIIFNDTPMITFRLSYIHHWVEMDMERGQITFVSQPFFIAHWGIEYISGIHADPEHPERIHLYFGVEDKVAMECRTTLHDLRVGKAVR